jgi:prepilin-type N-terminal cleavage/methylation domain-containing protein
MRSTGRPIANRPRRRGLTIVELMVTLAITGVLLAVAVPSMREYIARQRVLGTAQELSTDLRYLRSLRAQRTDQIRIDFGSTDDFTCYILYARGGGFGTCDCRRVNVPICDDVFNPPVELKTVVLPRSRGLVVTSDPVRLTLDVNGMPVGGTTLAVSVSGITLGGEIRVTTNPVATPALCSVSGHGTSLPACP